MTTDLKVWTVPTQHAILERSEAGPLTTLWCGTALLAVFPTGQDALALRVAELLDQHGLVDTPDSCAEMG